MKVLEVTYWTSRYVDDEWNVMNTVQRLAVADEQAERLLCMDFTLETFPTCVTTGILQYTLIYIEKLKNCTYIFDSISKIKEAKDYESLCEFEKQ